MTTCNGPGVCKAHYIISFQLLNNSEPDTTVLISHVRELTPREVELHKQGHLGSRYCTGIEASRKQVSWISLYSQLLKHCMTPTTPLAQTIFPDQPVLNAPSLCSESGLWGAKQRQPGIQKSWHCAQRQDTQFQAQSLTTVMTLEISLGPSNLNLLISEKSIIPIVLSLYSFIGYMLHNSTLCNLRFKL